MVCNRYSTGNTVDVQQKTQHIFLFFNMELLKYEGSHLMTNLQVGLESDLSRSLLHERYRCLVMIWRLPVYHEERALTHILQVVNPPGQPQV